MIDDQGMLNTVVSRQMSQISRYSVRSESGSVLITPEAGSASEFHLKKLIGKARRSRGTHAHRRVTNTTHNSLAALELMLEAEPLVPADLLT